MLAARIPVFENGSTDIVAALLNTKDLLGIGFERELPIRTVLEAFKASHRVHRIHMSTKLDQALEKCKRDHVHLLVVTKDDPGHSAARAVGITTFEDIIEEILQEEIVDETDVYVDAAQAPLEDDVDEGMRADARLVDDNEGSCGPRGRSGSQSSHGSSGDVSSTRPRIPVKAKALASNKNLLGYDNTTLLKSYAPTGHIARESMRSM